MKGGDSGHMFRDCTRSDCSQGYGLHPRYGIETTEALQEDVPISGRRASKPSVMCRVLLIPVGRRQRATARETIPLPAPSSTLVPAIHVSTSEQCPKHEGGKKRQSEPQTLSCPPGHPSYAEVEILRVPCHRAILDLRTVSHLFARVEVVAESRRSRG